MNKLGPSFHRTFALNRPAVVSILRLVLNLENTPGDKPSLDFKTIANGTSLGPVHIAAMRRYAFGAGLLDEQERLTPMARCIFHKDPDLQTITTCWLLHYGLSSPHGAGPIFWNGLVRDALRSGGELERQKVAQFIRESTQEAGNDEINEKTSLQSATVFMGTYSKSDALGPLGVLEQRDSGRYSVKEPEPPPLWVFGYVLADYWRANWGDVVGVGISRVSEPGGPGSLLMMGGGMVNQYLGKLQSEGLAVVQRRTPPFQVNRNWSNPAQFLERLYD